MRFAVCGDDPYDVNEIAIKRLESAGHKLARFGSLVTGKAGSTIDQARPPALDVSAGCGP